MLPISSDTKTDSVMKKSKRITDWERKALIENEIIMMIDFFYKKKIPQLIDTDRRKALHYDDLLTMRSRYLEENIYYDGYLDRIQEHQIFCYKEKFYNSEGELITTEPINFNTGAILVMTEDGTLFLSHKKRDVIHHSTFLAGGPVAYACMLEIKEGIIVKIDNWSGHYAPSSEQKKQFDHRLAQSFALAYDDRLTPIFLLAHDLHWYEHCCVISRKPLLEPVLLPCNHTFNRQPLARWLKTRKYCPLDNKPVEASELCYDVEKLQTVCSKISHVMSDIRNCQAELDIKVKELKLDDTNRDRIATVSHRKGVLLLLDSRTTFRRVAEIFKQLEIYQPPQDRRRSLTFHVNGYSHHYDDQLTDICTSNPYRQGIPTISWQYS